MADSYPAGIEAAAEMPLGAQKDVVELLAKYPIDGEPHANARIAAIPSG